MAGADHPIVRFIRLSCRYAPCRRQGSPDLDPSAIATKLKSFKRLLGPAGRAGAITAGSLFPHNVEEQDDGILLFRKVVGFALTTATYSAPGARQAGFAKQCVGDLHEVVSRHIFGGVGSFDVKMVRLRDHD